MKRRLVFSILVVCGLSLMLVLTGCKKSSSSTSPGTLYSLTGTWQFSPNADWAYLILYLTQSGQNVTGTADRAAPAGGGHDTGTVTSGTNIDNQVTITVQFEDMQILELSGTLTGDAAMNGKTRSYYPGDTPQDYYEVWSATKN